jgi:hypothetical protein
VTASLAVAQTPQELRNRYGEPEVERFRPRPGISLSVEYGSDHLACRILIQPSQELLNQEEEAQFMSSETVTDILEEAVPLAPHAVRAAVTRRERAGVTAAAIAPATVAGFALIKCGCSLAA